MFNKTFRRRVMIAGKVFLAVFLTLSIFTLGIQKVFLNPATYQQALRDQNFSENLPAILINQITGTDQTSSLLDNPSGVLGFSRSQIENLLAMILTLPEVERQNQDLIDQFWAFFTLQSNTITYDLGAIKQSMDGRAGEDILRTFFKLQPSCSANELSQVLLFNPFDPESQLPICRFSDQITEFILPFIMPLIQATLSTLPDRISIAEMGTGNSAMFHIPKSYASIYKFAYHALSVIPVIAIIILFLMLFLSAPGKKNILKTLSLPLIVAGGTSLLLSTILFILLNSVLINQIRIKLPDFSIKLVEMIEEIIRQIGTSFILTIGLAGLAILIAGAISQAASEWKYENH